MPPHSGTAGVFTQLGGLFAGEQNFRSSSDEPRLITKVVDLGDVSELQSDVPPVLQVQRSRTSMQGTGVGLDDGDSFLPAAAEGLERYCTSVFSDAQFTRASANELGESALDLDSVPRCSKFELSNSRCPLVTPDKKADIRWIRGASLHNGGSIYLPAVMVYLIPSFSCQAERFWFPITTGCAAHTSYESAVLRAILEVIERDALSIVWLQKLSLPRIEIDSVPHQLAPYWERYQRGSKDLEYVFFDATTDLGVPTIYGLQICKTNQRVTTLVSCSATLNPIEAITKVIRDMAACRIAFRNPRAVPESFEEFKDIFDGATYMARAENASAFDFLLKSGRTRSLSEISNLEMTDDRQALHMILDRFRSRNMDVYAVDLTTDEALRVGMKVVRVVIPRLQPLSFHYLARFLGHPRIYEAPKNMGYPACDERHMNHWPQPFS